MYRFDSKIKLGPVTLNVTNLKQEVQYYEDVLGLVILSHSLNTISMGIKNSKTILVNLKKMINNSKSQYGLYHFAIVLPSRSDLGNFLVHLIQNNIETVGVADHGYSEAIYLEDAEGNGIEIYHDKALSDWDIQGDQIISVTEQMDIDGILKSAKQTPTEKYTMPYHAKMGHFHLSVPSANESSKFYQKLFDMTETFSIPSASWISSGNYHHHFAFNNWATSEVHRQPKNMLGLANLTFYVDDDLYFEKIKDNANREKALHLETAQELNIHDPSGNQIIVKKEMTNTIH